MKILKYIILLSSLSSIFFVIYRQSDEKGFRRWRISFKIACIIAASVAGLIPVNTEAMEPAVNNTQVVHARVIGELEFNLLEENDQEVILAKSDGNSITPPTNRGPTSFSTPPSGGRPS